MTTSMRALILRGDAAHLPLPDASVDLIVTSPPYFGLRSYTDGGEHYDGQIGNEATPRAYLEALWACTAEWVRVLKPSGSLFVNLGDKYASGGRATYNGTWRRDKAGGNEARAADGMREKSLLGMPWRYALGCVDQTSEHYRAEYIASLYDDVLRGEMTWRAFSRAAKAFDAEPKSAGLGLILRAEIVWAKPNGLPESVTDRVRRSHEQVFHFTRQPRYYSAVDEVREAHSGPWKSPGGSNPAKAIGPADRNGHSQWERTREERDATVRNPLGKLPDSVWSIPSAPLTVPAHLGVDHFAAYPPELVRRIILGWSPAAVCTGCGEGRRPVSERGYDLLATRSERSKAFRALEPLAKTRMYDQTMSGRTTITGYACACPDATAPATPGIVLDPFCGTGTSMLVASVFGRIGIGVDRSADYCRLAQWRCSDPGERARAMDVPKPPPVADGQEPLF